MEGYGAGAGATPPDFNIAPPTQIAPLPSPGMNPLYQMIQESINAKAQPSQGFSPSQGNTAFGGVQGMDDMMNRPQLSPEYSSAIQSITNAPQQQAPSWNPNTSFGGVPGMDDMMNRPDGASMQKKMLSQMLGGY